MIAWSQHSKDQLAGYEVSKGTIRFPFSKPVPIRLIDRITTFRVDEVATQQVKGRRKKR